LGGKRQLIAQISERLPASFGRYHEPFVGGGALFFHLHPKRAFLSDRNERLVRAFKGIQGQVEEVIKLLKSHRHEKDYYLNLRKQDIDSGTDAEVAAWLIFLNKTGFNGLYRVNSHNQFNVPFGSNPRALICDEDNLRQCHKALAGASIHAEDFSAVLRRAKAGDLVYFDPPYVPVSDTAYFTSYTSGKFGPTDQDRLRDVALELKKREVFVILSNSSAPLVRELYSPKFTCIPVKATRVVNSKASGRGQVTELLMF